MGSFSIWHWLIVLAVELVIFGGGGKISRIMGDFGRGLKSFKKNIREEEEEDAQDAAGAVDSRRLAADAGEEIKAAPARKKTSRAK